MKKAKIIVLSGQSNAVGVGHMKCLHRHFTEEKIKEYKAGYEKISISYYSQDKKSDGFTVTATNCTELHKDTLGPEVGMAEYLTEKYPGEEFFIVKFAMGGASLRRDFLPPSCGGYDNPTDFKEEYRGFIDAFFAQKPVKAGWCYTGLCSILSDSIADLEAKGYAPEIIGFCWMQGESDSEAPENVKQYSAFFDHFIQDFKQAFSPYVQNCVFVDAGISEVWEYHREINAFKAEYARTHRDFVYIDTIAEGLTTRYEPVEEPDIYHYDSGSIVKLGRLFAGAIVK